MLNIDKITYAGNESNLIHLKNNKNYKFYKADINDQSLLDNILFKFRPDVIVNFAAESHVDRSIDDSTDFIKTNVLGTFSLLNSSLKYFRAKNNEFKFIHVSTDEVLVH